MFNEQMKKTFLKVKLPVSIFKEGKHFIAYTTALDLSTSGKTYAEVKRRFDEAVKIFFEEIIEKGTFDVLYKIKKQIIGEGAG